MKYWLTTHWPPRVDEPAAHHGVWLQHDKLHVAQPMQAGDLVLIYESARGKPVREVYADGSTKIVQRRSGRQGLVAVARIVDRPSEPEGSQPEFYADGTKKWWRFMAPTETLNSTGFLSRTDLNLQLGYSTNYVFHGFGEDRSGLAQISENQFEVLKQGFLQGLTSHDLATKKMLSAKRWGGPGGEGPSHLALKLAIAEDPVSHLGEQGLKHWATEYELPTGDTIDVVLTDEFGRFVVVEVEVDCEEAEIIGPLQCMKYRALMSYLHDRPLAEVRAMLVAHSIHSEVQSRCSKHLIGCRVCARDLLLTTHPAATTMVESA
jgi:hypothetical protein